MMWLLQVLTTFINWTPILSHGKMLGTHKLNFIFVIKRTSRWLFETDVKKPLCSTSTAAEEMEWWKWNRWAWKSRLPILPLIYDRLLNLNYFSFFHMVWPILFIKTTAELLKIAVTKEKTSWFYEEKCF